MVLRSHWTATAVTAAALALAGCSAPETDDGTASPSPTSSDTAAASGEGGAEQPEAEESPSGPDVQATSGAIVDGFPSVLVPLPDAEIVSSSFQPAGDGQPVVANLTMRTASSEEEVLSFYADHFEGAEFSPVSDPNADGGITTQSYHADDAGQLVSVGIAPDVGGEGNLLVTVGGQVLP